ncbi:hypothetical protein D1610_11690 [Sphingomonas gilva]|uniref:Phage tail assembly protein n=1 Tax=Sphingomonas gilva TaxID=2305907 RepID=A0A396S1F3_9SPHN|nr:phage tail assembly protein [Sphingomonas gilva]RHW17205.1 hypothetical protein D1610_11690 [Sphingomonas gilva]
MAEKRRYALKHPIRVVTLSEAGVEKESFIREVTLAERIKGRHMRAADKATGPASAKLLMLGALVGLSAREMDEMDGEDIDTIDAIFEGDADALAQVVTGPLADGQATGPTPSTT